MTKWRFRDIETGERKPGTSNTRRRHSKLSLYLIITALLVLIACVLANLLAFVYLHSRRATVISAVVNKTLSAIDRDMDRYGSMMDQRVAVLEDLKLALKQLGRELEGRSDLHVQDNRRL